jgi:hypothetical protein
MEDRAMIASPAASDCDPARIFVAIELSKKSWLMALLTPLGDRISLHTLPAGDGSALLQLLAAVRRKAEVALGGSRSSAIGARASRRCAPAMAAPCRPGSPPRSGAS